MATLSELLTRALQVYNEQVENMNSNVRIGSLLRDIVNFLDTKQDKEAGKGLSANDFSNVDKANLSTLVGLLNDNPDNVLNTISEVFKILESYPEGVKVVDLLFGKLDKGGFNGTAMDLADIIAALSGILQNSDLKDALYVSDSQGKIIAKIDASGLHIIDLNIYNDESNISHTINSAFLDSLTLSIFNKLDKGTFDGTADDLAAMLNNSYLLPDIQDGGNPSMENNYAGEFYIVDPSGRIIFKVTSSKIDYIDKDQDILDVVTPYLTNDKFSDPYLPADINMVISYGQSLSVVGSDTQTKDMTPALMFKNGVRVDYSEVQAADPSFVADFYGDDFLACAGTGFENTVKRMMYTYNLLLKNENNLDPANAGFQFISSVPGISGINIEGLAKGTYAYTRLIQSIQAAKRIANASNKTFAVSGLFWIQGESNYIADTVDSYYSKLSTLFDDLNDDIKAITGQADDVQFVCYQMASNTNPWSYWRNATFNVIKATMKLIKERQNVHLACAMYNWYYADELHPDYGGKPYFAMGAQAGTLLKRIVSDKNVPKLFGVDSYSVTAKDAGGYLLDLKFDVPVKPLVFDTSGTYYCNPFGAQANMGFSMKNIMDVTTFFPLGNNQHHTLSSAIAAIPTANRKSGAVIKYRTAWSALVTDTDSYTEVAYDSTKNRWLPSLMYPANYFPSGTIVNVNDVTTKSFQSIVNKAGYPQKRTETWEVKEFFQGDPTTSDWTNVANWRDSSLVESELIQSVRIAREDHVIVELSESPSGKLLAYAQKGMMGGGNLRDSQGLKIKVPIQGENVPIYNWCPMFELFVN